MFRVFFITQLTKKLFFGFFICDKLQPVKPNLNKQMYLSRHLGLTLS